MSQIEPTGDFMVYLCPSDKNPKIKYRCDMLANGGAGHCACKDWSTRRQPALDDGKLSLTKESACKHVIRVAWYLIREELKRLAREQDRPRR